MHALHRRVVWIVLLMCATSAVPATFGQEKCPSIMAALMPSGAENVVGNYGTAGETALGSAGADLKADPPCGNKNIKYPGHVAIGVTHYGAKFAKMFLSQVDAADQETLKTARAEFERKRPRNADPIVTEGVTSGDGTLMYFEYSKSCGINPGLEHHAYLIGLAHTRDTQIRVDIDGTLSAAAAKSAAQEVMLKFTKAKFNQAH